MRYQYGMDRRETQGEALRKWRLSQPGGPSQRACADRLAEFNDEKRKASQNAWCSWENGEKSPDIFFAFALERMTGGRIMAQGWAMSRPLPRSEPSDSTTNLVDGEALGKVG